MLKLQRRLVLADKIDIGCGDMTKPGFSGIDIVDFGQDSVWDVRDGLPYPDNSVKEIYTSHFVEHLENGELDDFFIEMLRVCEDGASITIRCPHADTIEALFVCHNSLWNENRMRGIVHGLRDHHKKPSIISMERDDINFIAKLGVNT